MKWKITLVLLVLLLTGQVKVNHKHGHQNTNPEIEIYAWDCKKIAEYLEAERSLFDIMFKRGYTIPKDDIYRYNSMSRVYSVVCREV